MATVIGSNQTKVNAGGSGSYVIEQGEFAGTVKSVYDTYETIAEMATGDLISMATPPAGSKIVGMTLSFDDLGTGCTLAVGFTGATGKYITATSAAAAGTTNLINVDAINYEIGTAAADAQTQLIIAGSVVDTASTIKLVTFYV